MLKNLFWKRLADIFNQSSDNKLIVCSALPQSSDIRMSCMVDGCPWEMYLLTLNLHESCVGDALHRHPSKIKQLRTKSDQYIVFIELAILHILRLHPELSIVVDIPSYLKSLSKAEACGGVWLGADVEVEYDGAVFANQVLVNHIISRRLQSDPCGSLTDMPLFDSAIDLRPFGRLIHCAVDFEDESTRHFDFGNDCKFGHICAIVDSIVVLSDPSCFEAWFRDIMVLKAFTFAHEYHFGFQWMLGTTLSQSELLSIAKYTLHRSSVADLLEKSQVVECSDFQAFMDMCFLEIGTVALRAQALETARSDTRFESATTSESSMRVLASIFVALSRRTFPELSRETHYNACCDFLNSAVKKRARCYMLVGKISDQCLTEWESCEERFDMPKRLPDKHTLARWLSLIISTKTRCGTPSIDWIEAQLPSECQRHFSYVKSSFRFTASDEVLEEFYNLVVALPNGIRLSACHKKLHDCLALPPKLSQSVDVPKRTALIPNGLVSTGARLDICLFNRQPSKAYKLRFIRTAAVAGALSTITPWRTISLNSEESSSFLADNIDRTKYFARHVDRTIDNSHVRVVVLRRIIDADSLHMIRNHVLESQEKSRCLTADDMGYVDHNPTSQKVSMKIEDFMKSGAKWSNLVAVESGKTPLKGLQKSTMLPVQLEDVLSSCGWNLESEGFFASKLSTYGPLHFDEEDTFYVCVSGKRNVTLVPPNVCRQFIKGNSNYADPAANPEDFPHEVITLEAGDGLLLPAGHFHKVQGIPDETIGLTMAYHWTSNPKSYRTPQSWGDMHDTLSDNLDVLNFVTGLLPVDTWEQFHLEEAVRKCSITVMGTSVFRNLIDQF